MLHQVIWSYNKHRKRSVSPQAVNAIAVEKGFT